jgi:hypothetical protein
MAIPKEGRSAGRGNNQRQFGDLDKALDYRTAR